MFTLTIKQPFCSFLKTAEHCKYFVFYLIVINSNIALHWLPLSNTKQVMCILTQVSSSEVTHNIYIIFLNGKCRIFLKELIMAVYALFHIKAVYALFHQSKNKHISVSYNLKQSSSYRAKATISNSNMAKLNKEDIQQIRDLLSSNPETEKYKTLKTDCLPLAMKKHCCETEKWDSTNFNRNTFFKESRPLSSRRL